jgi:hypothetical protein
MTDVLDRTVARPTADRSLREPPDLDPLGSSARISPHRRGTHLDLSPILGWILAALAAAAGVIHLVMVPSHWGESVAEGIGFAAAGWIQLAVAWLVLTRANRRLLYVGIGVSWALICAWVWSRTMGLPFGAHAGHAETAGFVDLTTVGFEAAFIGVAVFALARPGFGRSWTGSSLAFASVIPIAVVALATGAVASPSARDHAAGSHGEHGAAADHAHGTGAGATPVDDKGLSLLSNGHHHEIGLEKPLDAATRAQLTREMALTHQVGVMYPTIADAIAAGYTRAGPYTPGLGTHYIRPNEPGLNADGMMSDADILSPLSLIYAGTGLDSPIAGFMYYSLSEKAPVGFAGPNDIWHYHNNICMKNLPGGGFDTPLGADLDITEKDCKAVGGNLLKQSTWMVHVWSLPGWESQQGLFGEVNPALTCSDGTYYIMAKKHWPDHPLNFCKSEL